MSPMAKMCGTLVRICLSTGMKPRSLTVTPALSAPMLLAVRARGPPPAARGRRPRAPARAPAVGALEAWRACPSGSASSFDDLGLEHESSRSASRCGCASGLHEVGDRRPASGGPGTRPRSPWTPSASYTVAISRPMMPPPMTSRRFGTSAQLERAGRVDDARVVLREAGQLHRLRAGGDDAVVEARRSCRRPCVSHLQQVAARRTAPLPSTTRHLARLGHAAEAAGELADHLVLELAQACRDRSSACRSDSP